MASPVEPSLRERLDRLLQEVGCAAGGRAMLSDAQNLAAAVGIEFSNVRSVVEQAEKTLLGSTVATAVAEAVERPVLCLPLCREVAASPRRKQRSSGGTEPEHKRRPSSGGGGGGGAEDRLSITEDAERRPQPARSAFDLYCAEKRAEVLRRLELPPGTEDSAAADEALAQAWRDLDPPSKESYNACAAVEKQRCALDQLRRGVRSEAHAPKIAKRVREAIAIMGSAPKTARASGLFEGVVAALEDLDRRLGPRVRARLGEHLGPSVVSKEAQAIARKVFGQLNGTRLVMLLRRWCDPQLQAGIPAEPAQRQVRLNKPGTMVKVHSAGPTSDETRGRVTEFLARIFSRKPVDVAQSLSREIEQELFALLGSEPKEYRNRARALTFNLGAADGVLLSRVAEGQLAPAELVRLSAEDLASDALKAERDEERRKYYQSQVVVTERVPKRRRELFSGPPRGRAAERLDAGGPEEEPVASQSQDAAVPQAEGPPGEPEEAAPSALMDAAPEGVAPWFPALAQVEAERLAAVEDVAVPLPAVTQGEAEKQGAEEERAASLPAPVEGGATGLSAVEEPDASASAELDPGQASPRLRRGLAFAESELQDTEPGEAEREDAALRLLEDTSNDDAIARLIQMMPPTPSSSSGSSSDSDSESTPQAPAPPATAASSPGASCSQVSRLPSTASSSSVSSSPVPGALAGLERVLAMGFEQGAAEAALGEARGNVEAAVALLCGASQ